MELSAQQQEAKKLIELLNGDPSETFSLDVKNIGVMELVSNPKIIREAVGGLEKMQRQTIQLLANFNNRIAALEAAAEHAGFDLEDLANEAALFIPAEAANDG